ncbi:hypothetical protein MKEN_00559600 [Mycena kentingensis (nom. inval.)]|nr:hypothetical protein MKEN_00559600 [Mycena kentingensis (nom. inval.)]
MYTISSSATRVTAPRVQTNPAPSRLATTRPAHSAPPPIARGRPGAPASSSTGKPERNAIPTPTPMAYDPTQLAAPALLHLRPSTRDVLVGVAPHVFRESPIARMPHPLRSRSSSRSRARRSGYAHRPRRSSRSRGTSSSPSPSPSPSRRNSNPLRESPLRRVVSMTSIGVPEERKREADVAQTAVALKLYAPHKAIHPRAASPSIPHASSTSAPHRSTARDKPSPKVVDLWKSTGFRLDKAIKTFVSRHK